MNLTTIQSRVRILLRRNDLDVTDELAIILRDLTGYVGGKDSSVTLTVGTDGYVSLPTDTISVVSVNTGDCRLSQLPMTELLHVTEGGEPEYYSIWSDRLYVAPKPVEDTSFTILYKGYITDITTLNERWQEAVVNGVVWKVAVRLNLDANRQLLYRDYYMAEVERRKAELAVQPSFITYSELK